ncbi:unnamed protein product [Musa hybrid cultivar]
MIACTEQQKKLRARNREAYAITWIASLFVREKLDKDKMCHDDHGIVGGKRKRKRWPKWHMKYGDDTNGNWDVKCLLKYQTWKLSISRSCWRRRLIGSDTSTACRGRKGRTC